MTTEVRPQMTKGVLEPTTNTFAIRNGEVYDYYRVKFGDVRGEFVDILKLPPVLMEGFITYKGNLYKLSLRDYFRRRVNVGQPTYRNTTASDGGVDSSASSDQTSAQLDSPTRANSNKSGASSAFGLQEHEAADLAWKEQIDALQYLDDPEAEWVIEDNS